MISIKSEREIELLRIAGEITGSTHNYLKPYIKPGITTKRLNDLAEEYIKSRGATPSFKGYDGFPAAICISINDEVVHGIPGNRKLKEGDIVYTTSDRAEIRVEPNEESQKVATLGKGEKLTVLSISGNWYQISGSARGYIKSENTTYINPDESYENEEEPSTSPSRL